MLIQPHLKWRGPAWTYLNKITHENAWRLEVEINHPEGAVHFRFFGVQWVQDEPDENLWQFMPFPLDYAVIQNEVEGWVSDHIFDIFPDYAGDDDGDHGVEPRYCPSFRGCEY